MEEGLRVSELLRTDVTPPSPVGLEWLRSSWWNVSAQSDLSKYVLMRCHGLVALHPIRP